MYILVYIICGVIFEIFLLWEQVEEYGDYEFTIMDLFVGLSIILLWPFSMLINLFKKTVSFNTVLFRLKKKG